MSNLELFNLISKTYVGTKEIKLIANVGINKANEIRKEIEKEFCEGMLLPKYKIPTEYLLKKLRIDFKKVYDKAMLEKDLKGVR